MAVALLVKSLLALSPAVSLDGHALHFLALNVRNGHEQYSVHVQRSDAWEPAALEHASGDEWRLSIGDDTRILHAGPPDTVFSAAMGETTAPSLRAAAPHWPPSLLHSLETRRLSSDGTIAFDAATFLELLATTPVDAPLLLPDAARKLGLDGLARARDIAAAVHRPCATRRPKRPARAARPVPQLMSPFPRASLLRHRWRVGGCPLSWPRRHVGRRHPRATPRRVQHQLSRS